METSVPPTIRGETISFCSSENCDGDSDFISLEKEASGVRESVSAMAIVKISEIQETLFFDCLIFGSIRLR